MSIETVLAELLSFGEDEWLALWMIAGDVEEVLGIDDPNENLEITVGLVRELLMGLPCRRFAGPKQRCALQGLVQSRPGFHRRIHTSGMGAAR
jgi:hypothetical protein